MNKYSLVYDVPKIDPDYKYIASIIKLKDYSTLYSFYLLEDSFEIFKNIMKSDIYSIQYIQNHLDSLSEAAKVKLLISPHKPIPYEKEDGRNKDDEFYISAWLS